MKIVEIRRHSHRDRDDPAGGLSTEGISLAQKTANILEKAYDSYYSSPRRRAIQTMENFGFWNSILDDRFDVISGEALKEYADKIQDAGKENKTLLESYFSIPEIHPILREIGKRVMDAIFEISEKLPEGGKALVVSHGGTIEPACLIALKEKFELEIIGGELKECEGVRFIIEGKEVVGVEILRIVK